MGLWREAMTRRRRLATFGLACVVVNVYVKDAANNDFDSLLRADVLGTSTELLASGNDARPTIALPAE